MTATKDMILSDKTNHWESASDEEQRIATQLSNLYGREDVEDKENPEIELFSA